jgi:PiT family inorganic phosphate transporter
MLSILIIASLIYGFLNGFHDSSNIVATVISSRALRPRSALLLTAFCEGVAPFLFGVAVANTVGKDLLDPAVISDYVILTAISAAILWNLFTWFISIPSSSSHALIGGLLGAAIAASGLPVVRLGGLSKVLVALFLSPPLGLIFGYLLMKATLFIFQGATPRVNLTFKRLQIVTAISLALSHGSNDSQKTMAILAMSLMISGQTHVFAVPLWVIAASAAMMGLGSLFGGWRLIRTLGGRIYKIRPVHAFTSQAASAAIVLGAALLGGPVSASQVVGTAIMGAGAAERVNKVRWQVARDMIVTWVVTIPASAFLAGILYWLVTATG